MAQKTITIENNTLSSQNNLDLQYNILTEKIDSTTNPSMTFKSNANLNKGIKSDLITAAVNISVVNALNKIYDLANSAKSLANSASSSADSIPGIQASLESLQSTVESLQSTVDGLVANGGSGSGSGSGSTQPVNLDGYVTTEDLNTRLADYATTEALNTVSESIPNSADFVTTTDLTTTLEGYATTADIPSAPDLSEYATKAELADYALTSALNTYATKEELNGYVTTTALTGYNYVTSDALTATLNTRLANYMTATEVNQAIATYAANNSVDGLTLEFIELTAEEKASLVAEPPANLLDIINTRMPLETATAEQLEAYSKKIYVVPSFEDGNNDCTEFYLNTKNNPPTWEVFGTAVESLDEIIVAHIEDVPENN